MLTQNFKTAGDLGVTEEELAALIHVLGRLERGELKQAPKYHKEATGDIFDMGTEVVLNACGTVGCIGGWAAIFMGMDTDVDVVDYVNRYIADGALNDLYWHSRAINSNTTPEQGATALRNFLTTGEARWAEVLGS